MTRHRNYWYINRTLCDVLEEMRTCVKGMTFGALPGLIEEAQLLGNRMETALGNMKEIPKMDQEYERLRQEIKKLNAKLPPEKDD